MGKKDLWQSDYFEDKRRFADMVNGSLFQGKQLVKAGELEEVDSQLVYHGKTEETVKVIRDKAYRWKGQQVSIVVLENQSYIDYRMVFRVMLEEVIGYLKQQKRAYRKWKDNGYPFTQEEFLSQMRKEEKFIPEIILVVNLDRKKWDGAKSLYELLDIEEELKPFVTNYKINVFDYHEYREFSNFQTENRFLFELLSNSKNEEKMDKIIKQYLNEYELEEEAAKAIFGMLDIKVDINDYMEKTEKGRNCNMCKAWDDHMERGRTEGRIEGEQNAIKKSLQVFIGALKEYSTDFEKIYQSVSKQEIYAGVTREQVMEYYNA